MRACERTIYTADIKKNLDLAGAAALCKVPQLDNYYLIYNHRRRRRCKDDLKLQFLHPGAFVQL